MPSTADGKRGRALLAKAGAKPPSAQDAARANAFEAQLSGAARPRRADAEIEFTPGEAGKRARELVMQSDFPAILVQDGTGRHKPLFHEFRPRDGLATHPALMLGRAQDEPGGRLFSSEYGAHERANREQPSSSGEDDGDAADGPALEARTTVTRRKLTAQQQAEISALMAKVQRRKGRAALVSFVSAAGAEGGRTGGAAAAAAEAQVAGTQAKIAGAEAKEDPRLGAARGGRRGRGTARGQDEGAQTARAAVEDVRARRRLAARAEGARPSRGRARAQPCGAEAAV